MSAAAVLEGLGIFALAWLAMGTCVTLGYALLWRRRPDPRHLLAWPLVHAAMFFGDLAPGHSLPDGRTSLRQRRRPRPRAVSPLSAEELLQEVADDLAGDWTRVCDDVRVALSSVAAEFLDDDSDPTGRLRMRVSAALLSEGTLPDPDGFAALAEVEADLPMLVMDRSKQVQRERFARDWAALGRPRPRTRRR